MKAKTVGICILALTLLFGILFHSFTFTNVFAIHEDVSTEDPCVSSRIAKISWPFEIISEPSDSWTIFSSEMVFQLINPFSYDVGAVSGSSRMFYLKVVAEFENSSIEVFTDDAGFAIGTFYDITPGITNITQDTSLTFNQPNLSHLPNGNYSLSYDLCDLNDFDFYTYKLYLEVNSAKVTISQEDGSFAIVILNNTSSFNSTDTNRTQFSLPILVLVLLSILAFPRFAKRKKRMDR